MIFKIRRMNIQWPNLFLSLLVGLVILDSSSFASKKLESCVIKESSNNAVSFLFRLTKYHTKPFGYSHEQFKL